MFCSGCLVALKVDEYFECSLSPCGKKYCGLCANISSAADIKLWKCPACCTMEKKKGDNSSTPIRSNYHSLNVTTRKKTNSASSTGSIVAATPGTEVSELTSEIRLLTQEISSLKLRLEEATTSLTKCHSRLDELNATMVSTDMRLSKLEQSERQVVTLQATVSQLQIKLNTEAQNHLKNEIEVAGIPESTSENLMHTVLVTAKKIGVDLTEQDIDWVARAGPRRKKGGQLDYIPARDQDSQLPRPVVIRLLRRHKRDALIKASKSRRNLTSTDLGVSGPSVKIYFNDRLTKENRQLFRDARNISKQQGFAYCWCSQGAIYVRQSEGKPAQQVRTQDDLARVFAGVTVAPSTQNLSSNI